MGHDLRDALAQVLADDADVGRFLKLFTILPMDEIARLEALEGAEINEAKKVLATEATALLHGREAAELAAETARKTFEQGTLAYQAGFTGPGYLVAMAVVVAVAAALLTWRVLRLRP